MSTIRFQKRTSSTFPLIKHWCLDYPSPTILYILTKKKTEFFLLVHILTIETCWGFVGNTDSPLYISICDDRGNCEILFQDSISSNTEYSFTILTLCENILYVEFQLGNSNSDLCIDEGTLDSVTIFTQNIELKNTEAQRIELMGTILFSIYKIMLYVIFF